MVNISYIIQCSGFTYLKGGRTGSSKVLHFTSQYGPFHCWAGMVKARRPTFAFPIFTVMAAVSPVMAARRERFTLHLLPKPTFTILHFPTCRQIIFKARKYFLLDAMNQLPCLPAPEKCPSVSGNKRQLHQTAQVFSMYSQGCHLPWLLQCGPRWFYKMTGGRKRGVKELTDFHSPTVGGRIRAAASAAWHVHHIQQFPAHTPGWSASYRLSQF